MEWAKWSFILIFSIVFLFTLFLAYKLHFLPLIIGYIALYMLTLVLYANRSKASVLPIVVMYFLPIIFISKVITSSSQATGVDGIGIVIDFFGSIIVLVTVLSGDSASRFFIAASVILTVIGFVYSIYIDPFAPLGDVIWFFKILAVDPVFIFLAYWGFKTSGEKKRVVRLSIPMSIVIVEALIITRRCQGPYCWAKLNFVSSVSGVLTQVRLIYADGRRSCWNGMLPIIANQPMSIWLQDIIPCNRLSCNLISPITGVEFIINGIPYRATVLPSIGDPLNPQPLNNALRFTGVGWC